MNVRHQHSLVKLTIVGLFILNVSGCGPGRKAQCQDLGQATQTVMNTIQATHQSQLGRNSYDPDFERKLANTWEQGVSIVNSVELSDKTLQALRDDLAVAYQQAADIRRQVADITPANGRPSAALESQINALNMQSGKGIPSAINELNLYCL